VHGYDGKELAGVGVRGSNFVGEHVTANQRITSAGKIGG
jgi:hypothetical protein